MSYPTPPTTDNHGLPLVPPIGETNAEDFEDEWGEILNDKGWAYLEEQLIVRDTDSNRSNYSPYDGALFWATDGQQPIYEGTGSAWELASAKFDTTSAQTDRTTHKDIVERGLSGTETLQINDGESMVVSGEVDIQDSAELTVSGSGEFHVI